MTFNRFLYFTAGANGPAADSPPADSSKESPDGKSEPDIPSGIYILFLFVPVRSAFWNFIQGLTINLINPWKKQVQGRRLLVGIHLVEALWNCRFISQLLRFSLLHSVLLHQLSSRFINCLGVLNILCCFPRVMIFDFVLFAQIKVVVPACHV